jgi:flagellar hook-length control protein FliK
MNLSSYLQMPPAPLVPSNPSHAMPQGPGAGAGPSAGDGLGVDFAQLMTQQLSHLSQVSAQERQNFAAAASARTRINEDDHASRPVEERHEERDTAPAAQQPARATRADEDQADQASEERAAKHAQQQRNKTSAQKNQAREVDALLEGLLQGASVAPASASSTGAHLPDPASQALGTAAKLQSVALGPQIHIITDPQQAPSQESLAVFAKSMGLDESTIQNLLAQQPALPATALANASSTLGGGFTTGLPGTEPNALQAAMNTVLEGVNLGNTEPSADHLAASRLAAMAATANTAASGAGLAAAATTLTALTLAGLTTTDMAAIQQLQITVLPAAVLPLNATANPAPRTIDMLSLLGTGMSEHDVGELLSRFSQETSDDSQPDTNGSHSEDSPMSGFAQALANPKNSAHHAPTNATTASGLNMGEVYDQLSDKMATEMAARMHKQLSDGEWKMKFALRPSNLGGVEIQLEMKDGKLDAVFRADNPLTRDLLQNSSQRLREALGQFGIHAGQVNVGQGGGQSQQNNAGHAGKRSQVSDNSTSPVNAASGASGTSSGRNKANASLLDLYA